MIGHLRLFGSPTFYGSLLRKFPLAKSESPFGGEGGKIRQVAFYVFLTLMSFLMSLHIFNYKKKLKVARKEFRRGIEPGSSGRKARLITIRPRDGLLEAGCFFIYLNHLNFSRISKIVATAATNAEAYLRELL